jgi:hypothetical protein
MIFDENAPWLDWSEIVRAPIDRAVVVVARPLAAQQPPVPPGSASEIKRRIVRRGIDARLVAFAEGERQS